MWRWLSGLPRAIRQHFHGPRASTTGVCRDDDIEQHDQCKDVQSVTVLEKDQIGIFTCRSRRHEKSKDGPDQDKWYRDYTKDFCSFLNGNHHALEALGWGAAVVLGIHLSKCPIQNERRCIVPGEEGSKRCLLWQVAFALPDPTRTTKKSVASSKKEVKPDVNASQKESGDPLYAVMNEFEDMCKKYTGLGKNIQGLREASKQHMTKAVDSFKDASCLGYTKAQFNLGLCYETGKGVKVNLQKAIKYYKLAADDGHPQALYNLALLYLRGEDCIEKDVPLALELLKKAAENGLSQAQTQLGVYYTEEETQDLEKAVSFFEAAAAQNDPEAQYFLAVCYEEGWGVEQNICKSAELYSLSASSGHDGALYSLGVFNEQGLGGIAEDKDQALELYKKSADAGNEQAVIKLKKITSEKQKDWNASHEGYIQVQENQEIQKKVKEESSIKLSVSTSSPSLTDYVRNHLTSFSSSVPYNFLDPISLLRNKPVTTVPLRTGSIQRDIIEDLSPLLSEIPAPTFVERNSSNEKVLFSLGADEDDIDSLVDSDINIASDSITSPDNPQQIHHFCSFIQKNSTMPNLQCVSCN